MTQTMQGVALSRTPGPQWVGGQFVQWGTPVKREDRKILRWSLGIAAMGAGLLGAFAAGMSIFPFVAGYTSAPFYGVAHLLERAKNGVEKTDEMEFRAKFYSRQIYRTLGISPKSGQYASVELFRQAAAINPELAKVYQAPLRKESKENKHSLLINGGIVGAGWLTGAGGALAGAAEFTHKAIEGVKIFGEVGKATKFVRGTMQTAALLARDESGKLAGEALAHAFSQDKLDPHEILEALDKSLVAAQAQGIPVTEVVTPERLFALRVAQDEGFADQLTKQFGKPFHKLDEGMQLQAMAAYPALANAVTTEASAVAQGILPVKELAASKPNLNSNAQQYAVGGGGNSSFAAMVQSRRAAANDPSMNAPNVRNISSHADRLRAQRAAAAAQVGVKA